MTHNDIPLDGTTDNTANNKEKNKEINKASNAQKSTENSKTWLPAESEAAFLAAADLQGVENVLKNAIRSSLPDPKALADRLILSGGKRLRPFLLSLTARSLSEKIKSSQNISPPRASDEDLHHLGAVSELVHTATLFHDDVIDQSETRRNLTSTHILHGNKCAILVGDFVYAEAFFVLMERGLLEASRKLASTVKTIVEGELLQLQCAQTRSLKIDEYLQIATAKTASLFGWCTGTGAWVSGSPEFEKAEQFGLLLGLAFQMADDVIDCFEINPFTAEEQELDSWFESAPPFPLIVATLQSGQSTMIESSWSQKFSSLSLLQKRECINSLQKMCANSVSLNHVLSQIKDVLFKADFLLSDLNIFKEMSWTTRSILARAEQGAALAQSAGTEESRNVIL